MPGCNQCGAYEKIFNHTKDGDKLIKESCTKKRTLRMLAWLRENRNKPLNEQDSLACFQLK
jgi:hypothetical protein